MEGNRPVPGLRAEDFELRDSGRLQPVQSTSLADVPVSLLLALDTSTSVGGGTLEQLKEASEAALASLAADDRSALLTFASAVTLRADWGAPDVSVREAIQTVEAGGSTSLFDAAFAALTYRDTLPGRRSLVVLFSDGADTSSWLPSHAALDKARRTDAVVYAVGTAAPENRLEYRSGIQLRDVPYRPPFEATPFVRELAALTGGDMMPAVSGRLRDTFTRIVTGFRSRYVLTYTPTGVDHAGWHPIEVKVKGRRARITARRGYVR
jgi:VWFA-related protein